MTKNTAFHFSYNIPSWILVVLISLSLASCSMKTITYTKPWTLDPKEVFSYHSSINAMDSVIFSPDNKTLITGCVNNQILVWDAKTRKLLKSLETITPEMRPMNNTDFNRVFLSPDGNIAVNVLMYHPRGRMQIWDIQKGELLHTLKGHEGWIWGVAFSPDSKIMASGGFDRAILLWNIQTGESLGILEEFDEIQSLAFSSDGKILAAGNSVDASKKEVIGTIHIWDIQTREIMHTLKGHEKTTECLAFSPDGKTLASGGWDGTMRLWDVQTGKQIRILTDKDTGGPVFSIAFSPDGRMIATGGWDGIARLWDAETGVVLKKMRQPGFFSSTTSGIRSVAFSPDGETLAAGIMDGTAIIWKVKTGKRLRTLHNPKTW